ncbi:F-box domain [Arabidopsis thaliana x Arabidopsis arenosa]|uniref:F-box domain n=1 Tax=Arabidopsis thaliana x Arabidopsis arenosa TaxID=1240361 RepID=A0A8T2BDU7_9BRAS|nr:F-box domain [Arabidopsis thaliana x Arabidopsis arenosa]
MTRCKTGSVVDADRISQLPEALILQILCLLATKVAITTSVLSKQWQSLWKMLPKLNFDSLLHRLELENVCKSLQLHKAPVLESFNLRVHFAGSNYNAVDSGILTGVLIGIAMDLNVRELVLNVYIHHGSLRIPSSLYNSETLETLKLELNVVMDVPSLVSLKSLRTLHLKYVDFKDEESIRNLLSGCPNLEDFMVHRSSSSSVKTFIIDVPTLQRLTIHNGDSSRIRERHCDYVISTPSLKYLKIEEGIRPFESFVIENVPELIEVNITNVSEIIDEKLLVFLTSVRRLSLALTPSVFKFPTGSIFDQLVYLELFTNKKAWWNLLPLMLHSSPSLQVLKLIDNLDGMNYVEASGVWNQPKNVPECLLFHLETFMWEGYKWKREEEILCLLPTKAAITTSVLSKQWRSHWKMLPKLNFKSLHRRLELENVCKSLLSHKAPVLQSFGLKVRLDGRNNAVDIGILIGIAFTRNVRELVLEVHFYRGFFKLPRSLYNCETLETLKLILNVDMDVPSSVSLKSLRTLHLNGVDFKDDESVFNLLSGCPNLQEFVVRRNSCSSLKTFTIQVPSLQRLTIHNGSGGQQPWGYVINTPSLKYLEIEGSKAFESFLIEDVPELMEVNITNVSEITDEKLLIVLTSVKRLSLALSHLVFTKLPTGSIFCELVYLELSTNPKAWWVLLTLMLHSSPKLKVLKLIDVSNYVQCWMDNVVASGEWNQQQNVPECLLSHLETFMWKGYKWKQREEREVAKYILKNTNRLKSATFYSKRISYEDRLAVVKDMKSVVKATNSCKIQFL